MENEAAKKSSPSSRTWGDLLPNAYNSMASSWRSKANDRTESDERLSDAASALTSTNGIEEQEVSSKGEVSDTASLLALANAGNAAVEGGSQEPAAENVEADKRSSKTWGDMVHPVLKPSHWRRKSSEGGPELHGDAESSSPRSVTQPEESSKGKAKVEWGQLIQPVLKASHWRNKSQDEKDVHEVQKPNPETLAEHVITDAESKGKESSEVVEKPVTQVPARKWAELIHPALKPSHWRKKSLDEGEAKAVDDALKDTSDVVPQAAEGTLSAVAASIRQSIAGMSRWSAGDLTLGLYKLSGRHALEGAADTINASRVTSLEELQELLHWFHWAFASYKKDKQKLIKELEIEESQIVKHIFTSAVLKPAYYIAVDHCRRSIVMSIRGTLAATDVLTDLNPHSEPFEGGLAHSGMLAAARWLMENEASTLTDLLAAHPEYRLVLVGHSLGAGTAALLCMLLREYDIKRAGPLSRLGIPPSWITCWGYGCPPCVDKRLAEEAGFIKNVVLQDDVVARVTPAALEDLRGEILDTDWSQAFKDGSKGKKMLELAQSTYAALPSSHIAKKYGNAALVAARTGALAGTRIYKAANWFTVGIAAAELLRSAALHASSAASNREEAAAASTKEALEMQRLYVPGVLYHVLRKPMEAEATSLEEATSSKASPKKLQHIVVRGDDPSSRFKRIVLSGTLLSDHGCVQYNDALVSAIQCCAVNEKGVKGVNGEG